MEKRKKRGVTLVELVIVMSVSVIAAGMILSMTLAITSNVQDSKRSEGVTAEMSLIRDSINLRNAQILSGKTIMAYNPVTKALSFTDSANPQISTSVTLFYLSALTQKTDTISKVMKVTLEFSGGKKNQVFSMLFSVRT